MSITLGSATKLLDDMMINYSEWHTERAPTGKKVNSVEETSSLSAKIDTIMSMLANGQTHVDPQRPRFHRRGPLLMTSFVVCLSSTLVMA